MARARLPQHRRLNRRRFSRAPQSQRDFASTHPHSRLRSRRSSTVAPVPPSLAPFNPHALIGCPSLHLPPPTCLRNLPPNHCPQINPIATLLTSLNPSLTDPPASLNRPPPSPQPLPPNHPSLPPSPPRSILPPLAPATRPPWLHSLAALADLAETVLAQAPAID